MVNNRGDRKSCDAAILFMMQKKLIFCRVGLSNMYVLYLAHIYTHKHIIFMYIYIYIYKSRSWTFISMYIYTCIYTCTHFFQRHKKEMSRSPSYLGLLTWLLGVFALRSDGTRRSVGDMIGTAEAGRDGVTAGQLPWKLFLLRLAFVENLLDDDKSLHTQFPKKSC